MIWMPFMVLMILVPVLVLWWTWQQGAGDSQQAMDIARRRLASGEIGHDEFERIKQQLEVGRSGRGSGQFSYYCSEHLNMVASVLVRP